MQNQDTFISTRKDYEAFKQFQEFQKCMKVMPEHDFIENKENSNIAENAQNVPEMSHRARRRNRKLMTQQEKQADNVLRRERRAKKSNIEKAARMVVYETGSSPEMSASKKSLSSSQKIQYRPKQKCDQSPVELTKNWEIEEMSDFLQNDISVDKLLQVLKSTMGKIPEKYRNELFSEFGRDDKISAKNLKAEISILENQNMNFESEREFYKAQILNLEKDLAKANSPFDQVMEERRNENLRKTTKFENEAQFQNESDLKSNFEDNEIIIPLNQEFQELINLGPDCNKHLAKPDENSGICSKLDDVDQNEVQEQIQAEFEGNIDEVEYQQSLKNEKTMGKSKKIEIQEPKKFICTTGEAKTMLANLEEARLAGDGDQLANLVFDAECEDLDKQIDLIYYENLAAKMIEEATSEF